MRYLRAGVLVALTGALLAIPAPALAQVDSLSVDGATLGPEGATLNVTLTYQCQAGWNVASGSVRVDQSTGKRLNTAAGFFFNNFPGVPCTGAPETREFLVFASTLPFKQGKASALATLSVFNPATGAFVTEVGAAQEIRVRK